MSINTKPSHFSWIRFGKSGQTQSCPTGMRLYHTDQSFRADDQNYVTRLRRSSLGFGQPAGVLCNPFGLADKDHELSSSKLVTAFAGLTQSLYTGLTPTPKSHSTDKSVYAWKSNVIFMTHVSSSACSRTTFEGVTAARSVE